jgi:hypothetical protein
MSMCVLFHIADDTTLIIIETPDVYNYSFVDDYGVYAVPSRQLVFSVRAKNDAHIALTK